MTPCAPAWADMARAAGTWARVCQTWSDRLTSAEALEDTARERLAALIAYARGHSPLYRDAYRHLPAEGACLHELPVMTRHSLMSHFDEWVTDPALTRRSVERFLADRSHIGERLLDRYAVWKSSGTSGEPGIYVHDDAALATYDALIAVQLARSDLTAACLTGMARGGRAALVAATGDHFASIASWQRACHAAPGLAARGFSILAPLRELTADLEAWSPAFLASYPTMLTVLAEERAAQRLDVAPCLVWSGGETLSPANHRALQAQFECPVVNEYGASECLSIAFSCARGALHVNADWVILEPVDAHYRPVAPGERSHSVLLTNLANRVQPIIRYDLGDAVCLETAPCACGSALPVLRVEGRCDDVLVLGEGSRRRKVLPMALGTILEEAAGVHRFQIVHDGARMLSLRLPRGHARAHAYARAAEALHAYLATLDVDPIEIRLDVRPPMPDPRSGKVRQVLVEQERRRSGATRGHAGRLPA